METTYNHKPRVEIGPEIIHGLDWDMANGNIDQEEYYELLQQIEDEQQIAIIRYGKEETSRSQEKG